MATLKRDDTRGPSDARVMLADLLDGSRPRDPEAAAVWRDCRRELAAAALGTRFDPRQILRLRTERERAAWTEARRLWIADLLRGDARVKGDE